MRVVRYVLGAVIAVTALNLVAWAFVGRGSALGLAATEFDAWGALDGNDTLHVYAHFGTGAEADSWTEPGDVTEAGRQRISSAFESLRPGTAVVHHRQRLGPLPDSLPPGHFILAPLVRRAVPLYAHSFATAYAPGFVSSREHRWVWLFGWRPVGPPDLSVS